MSPTELDLLVAGHHPDDLPPLPADLAGPSLVRTRSLAETLRRLRADPLPDLLLLHPLSGRCDGVEVAEVLATAKETADETSRPFPVVVVVLDRPLEQPVEVPLAVDDLLFSRGPAAEWTTRFSLAAQRARRHRAFHAELARSERERSTDFKTGLANDRAFFDRFHQEFERARRYHLPLSLILLDIDDFKALNDRHDHSFGDRVLAALGERLRAALRSSDVPARIGGDELALLLPQTDLDEASRLARRLRGQLCDRPVEDDRYRASLTVSMGIDSLRDSDGDKGELKRRAGLAMLEAKRQGKNSIVLFDAGTHEVREHSRSRASGAD